MRKTKMELMETAKAMRRLCMEMSFVAGDEGAHVGPALSIVDIMTVLYFDTMNYRPEDPQWERRDRFILSKGHGVLGLYAPLVMAGLISEQEAGTFNQADTRLAGHPSGKGVAGIEHPSGSLGHGLSVGCGIAFAGKADGKDYDTYVLVGDGEMEEGSIWEAVMFAKKYKLGNLVAIVDVNGYQYGGATCDLMDLSPMDEKWRAFGWNVVQADGNDVEALQKALDKANRAADVPTCIIANTVKGYGLSFTHGNNDWHHVELSAADLEKSLNELK